MKGLFRLSAFAVAPCLILLGCESAKDILNPTPTGFEKAESSSFSAAVEEPVSGDVTSVRLIAGRNTDIGTMSVWNDENNLYVKYRTSGDWRLVATHLAVEKNISAIPQNKPGNPKIGQFPFKSVHNPPAGEFVHALLLESKGIQEGDIIYIASQADVQRIQNGEVKQEEGAWCEGTSFPGRSPAMFFTHAIVLQSGWSDDFEEYAVGVFPSPNWLGSGNAVPPASCVDDARPMNGLKALKLYGIPNQKTAAGAHRLIDVDPPYTLEFSVCNGAEVLGPPGYFSRAAIFLRSGPSLDANARRLMECTPMGLLFGVTGPVLMTPFEKETWYKMKIKYESAGMNKIRATYWINDDPPVTQEADLLFEENKMKYLSLESFAGSVWYDGVSVSQ